MNKKVILIALAFVIAISCAVCLVACDKGNDGLVSASLVQDKTPEHVDRVQILDGNNTVAELGKNCGNGWATPKQIQKDKAYTLKVMLDQYYEAGTLKMFINDIETALEKETDGSCAYACQYTPTKDFVIKFEGAPALESANITLALDWNNYDPIINGDTSDADEYRTLKSLVSESVYIQVVVNGQPKVPFGTPIRLSALPNVLQNNAVLGLKKTDEVKIYIYTTSADLKAYNDFAMVLCDVTYDGGGMSCNPKPYEAYEENGKVGTVATFTVDKSETITIMPYFVYTSWN